jgi:nucleolar protein 15
MRQYFSQFGTINKLRLSRSKSTGASKHFGFIEFEEFAVAEIVAKTMDNYLLFGHILKCKVVPKSQIHDALWKGANKRFKKIPWNKMAGNKLKKPLTESGWSKKIEKEEKKRNARSAKLAEMGYDFDQPALKAAGDAPAIEGGKHEEVKAIEAAPEVEEDKENEEESAPKKKPAAAKAGKKAKGGSKAKKAKA